MMFAIPPIPPEQKVFVLVSEFGDRDWYLYDLRDLQGQGWPSRERQWIDNPKKAIKFSTAGEAEQVGEMVLKEDEYSIESFTTFG